MLHKIKNNTRTRSKHMERDPIQKIHRRLAWVLGTATGALIINAVAVVTIVEASSAIQ